MSFIIRSSGIPTAFLDDGEVLVEIAFDSGFADTIASRVYTDVTEYVDAGAGIEITHGRSDERSTPEPGSCQLTLANKDGRFTPENTASPYYPDVKKGKPLKVSVKYAGVWYVRFTGYIDEWPLTWPTGGDTEASIQITATTRRARLGRAAALTQSPIRAAYMLPDEPQAYWPMNFTRMTTGGGWEVFIDATNLGRSNEVTQNRLFIHPDPADSSPYYPTFTSNPRRGPVDENFENDEGQSIGLLRFPSYSDVGLLGDQTHYVGASNACRVGTAGELTLEFVARVEIPDVEGLGLLELAKIQTPTGTQVIVINVAAWGSAERTNVSCGMYLYDVNGAMIHYEDPAATVFQPDAFAIANDGEIHHYAFTLTVGGTVGTLYLDGTVAWTVTFPAPYVFEDDFTAILLGTDTYKATPWIGHCAVRDEALTVDEIAAHAAGATTQDESIEERLERVLGYVGVPPTEIEAETSVALGVGDQAQVGKGAIEVADELAESTAGIAYDKRDGTFYMQARNHRYNQTAAFTLSAADQEIEQDLTAVLDDRYLVNYVEVKRAENDELPYFFRDLDSIDAYGIYNAGTLEVATTSFEEARAAGLSMVDRYAEPKVRVSTVAVDLVDLDATKRASTLDADIGTLFEISDLPDQAPHDTMPLYLEGYTESLSIAGHALTMNTTPGDWDTNVLVLDDPDHNELDSGITLAY